MKKNILIGVFFVFALQLFAQKPASPKNKVNPKPAKQLKEYVKISTMYGDLIFTLFDETPKHKNNFKKLVKEHYYDDLLFHRIIRNFMIQGGDPNSRNADSVAQLGNGGPSYTIQAEINKKYYHVKGALCAARIGDEFNPNKESSGSQFYIVQGIKVKRKDLELMMNKRNYEKKQKVFNDFVLADTSIANKMEQLQKLSGNVAVSKFLGKLQPKIDSIYVKQEYIFSLDQAQDYETIGGTPHLDGDYTVFGILVEGFDVLDKIAIVYANPQTNRPLVDIKMRVSLINR
jgi:cyclophilin family peptidyl-prolyl cis-trans isomerase